MRLWDAHRLREMYLSHLASICQSEKEEDERPDLFFREVSVVMHDCACDSE